MFTLCWSAKGGSGTTVVAASLALISARTGPTVIIDLGGDVAAALGVATPSGPGVTEWLASPHADAGALWRLAVDVAPNLGLVHPGAAAVAGPTLPEVHAERLVAAMAACPHPVVVDAGQVIGPSSLHHCASSSLLVVRQCYLGLRRATALPSLAHGAVLVEEPGRALGAGDIERALGVPVVATVPWDPAVARAVDAGLLATRLPVSLGRQLGPVQQAEHVA
jgi:hypothetical protein